MFVVIKDNGNLIPVSETEDIDLDSLFVLFEEEIFSYKDNNKDCWKITAIFNKSNLEETPLFFSSNSTQQFLSRVDQITTIITVVVKKTFSPKKLKNLFDSSLCQVEISSETNVSIMSCCLSSKSKTIETNFICSSTLAIFEETDKLSKYSNIVKEMLSKI